MLVQYLLDSKFMWPQAFRLQERHCTLQLQRGPSAQSLEDCSCSQVCCPCSYLTNNIYIISIYINLGELRGSHGHIPKERSNNIQRGPHKYKYIYIISIYTYMEVLGSSVTMDTKSIPYVQRSCMYGTVHIDTLVLMYTQY